MIVKWLGEVLARSKRKEEYPSQTKRNNKSDPRSMQTVSIRQYKRDYHLLATRHARTPTPGSHHTTHRLRSSFASASYEVINPMKLHVR